MTGQGKSGEIVVRRATEADAPAMAALLNAIIAKGGTTAHRTPFTTERMVHHYVAAERGISCFVADAGAILGFQALDWPDPNWSGANPLAAGWAYIATFVAIGAQGRGVGGRLFTATRAAACSAGVKTIDATIRRENAGGQAYYGGLGFQEYWSDDTVIARKLDV